MLIPTESESRSLMLPKVEFSKPAGQLLIHRIVATVQTCNISTYCKCTVSVRYPVLYRYVLDKSRELSFFKSSIAKLKAKPKSKDAPDSDFAG